MKKIKIIPLSFIVVSFLFLIPGLTLPVLSFKIETKVDVKVRKFSGSGFDKTRSIVGTIKELLEIKRVLVAFLILLFSVLIPFIKILMLLFVLFHKSPNIKAKFYSIVNAIGKWSMADVFAVGIFIVYLSTAGREQVKSFDVRFLGMELPVKVSSVMVSSLGNGFYFFLGYCLVSIASLHFVKHYMGQEELN